MSFIRKDVNFGLLFIVILLAVSIASIGIYYNHKYGNLADSYHSQLTNLEKVTQDLLYHKSMLNETTTDLQIKEQDGSDLNRRYTELRDDKEGVDKRNTELDTSLKQKVAELTEKTNELVSAKSEVATQKIEIDDLNRMIEVYKTMVNDLEDKVDIICGGDITSC